MKKIDTLAKEIQLFEVEYTKQYNRDEEINKEKYFKLVKKINELKIEDFNSSEKCEHFYRYWNQDTRMAERFVISNSFKGNHIDLNFFLILSNDFIGAINWLKK